jgi:hypothetical protein
MKNPGITAILVAIIFSSCSFTGNRTNKADETAASEIFIENLGAYCGMELDGKIVTDSSNPANNGQNIQFMFDECPENEIRITALLPEKMVNTIILTLMKGEILLKHDVRNPDFSPAQHTMYGGFSLQQGSDTKQTFPVHNFGQTMWPGYEKYSWEICLGQEEIEYMELTEEMINKHYIIKIPSKNLVENVGEITQSN